MNLKVITQNPYRQLGIFANASTKDRVAAIGKLKAFLKVGRQMESPFDKILPAIERSVESVAEAEHQLTLPAEQMRYAQFWFVKATPIDEVAFNNLFAGNDVEAQNIWSKKLTASSLQNLIICKLLSEYYSEAITFAEKLYSEHADEFVQLVNGDAAMTKNLAQLSHSIVCFSCCTSNCASPRWFLCTTDFHFDERCRSHAQGSVDGLGLLRRTAARPELHLLAEGVDGLRSHEFLSEHAADNFRPIGRLAREFELVADGVHHPIGQ